SARPVLVRKGAAKGAQGDENPYTAGPQAVAQTLPMKSGSCPAPVDAQVPFLPPGRTGLGVQM
ncbi:MAG: hypothetical protein ACWGNB_09075, partial [Thiogranum sp.]